MNRKIANLVLMVFPLFMLWACRSHSPLETVEELKVENYMGKWYEIARLPNRFEDGLKCVTAEYSLRDDGKITVVNKGHQIENPEKVSSISGVARIPDPDKPGQLKVQFFWPFSGNYYIIKVDEQYQLALVGDPSRKYLWILAREKQIDESDFQRLSDLAAEKGFATGKLIHVDHDCKHSPDD
jgi:apolipoprotein D and lipocalin family protein